MKLDEKLQQEEFLGRQIWCKAIGPGLKSKGCRLRVEGHIFFAVPKLRDAKKTWDFHLA